MMLGEMLGVLALMAIVTVAVDGLVFAARRYSAWSRERRRGGVIANVGFRGDATRQTPR